jgi:nucleoside-diphosphate-sugar epimerase
MRVLVTGGAGFIGSSFAKKAKQQGWEVTVLDNLSTGHKSTVDELEKLGIRVIIGDIRDRELVSKEAENCTAVVHLAAQVSVPLSVEKPEETNEINVQGTDNVIQSCLDNDVQRLVVASSAAVYGNADNLPLKEQDAGQTLSPYAESKWVNEQQILEARNNGLKATALRFFNVYGVGQRPDGAYAAVVPKFVDMMVNQQAPKINGDGLHSRDFVHVDDVCDAIWSLIDGEWESENHHVYNIATQTKVTLLDLISMINNSLTSEMPNFTPLIPTHGPERVGDIRHSMASIARIKKTIQWSPKVEFEYGIKQLVLQRLNSQS